jgi:serine/threonine-protein kinase HipA
VALYVHTIKHFTPCYVGKIEVDEWGDQTFIYDERYAADPSSIPLSCALPLSQRSFDDRRTRAYFDALLPEERARTNVARALGIRGQDYLSILSAIGYECVGDVLISHGKAFDTGQPTYFALSSQNLHELAHASGEQIASMQVDARLSLAGAQMKAGLYHDERQPMQKGWYLPDGIAASTHIVKTPHVMEDLLVNECLVMRTAKACGIDTAEVALVNPQRPLLAIKRFDRFFAEDAPLVNGLPTPSRLHQEDFAQALGISGIHKYETALGNQSYTQWIGDLIIKFSSDAIADLRAFAQQILFGYLVGNCDNHLKNYSILTHPEQRIRLTPAYDLMSTTILGYSREMGIMLGDALLIDEVTTSSLQKFARDAGIPQKQVAEIGVTFAHSFKAKITEQAEVLAVEGYPKARMIARSIVEESRNRVDILAGLN